VRRIFDVQSGFVFGRVGDIQDSALCDTWRIAVAVPGTSQYNCQKILLAADVAGDCRRGPGDNYDELDMTANS